jgi:hypothetical protein
MKIIYIKHDHWGAVAGYLESVERQVYAYRPLLGKPATDRQAKLRTIRRMFDLVARFNHEGHAVQQLRLNQSWIAMMATEALELQRMVQGESPVVTSFSLLAGTLRDIAIDPKCWVKPDEEVK